MKVVLFGASGTVGRCIASELSKDHEVIAVGRSSAKQRADITQLESVEALLKSTGKIDAVVCATGKVHFGPLTSMTPALYNIGLQDKLMGQVNVALASLNFLNDGGSITLTSGILTDDVIRDGSSAAMVNGAVEAFVRAAAIEMPRGVRINCVNASVLEEAMGAYGPYFKGFEPVPGARSALAYRKSIDGAQTGQIYRVR